MRLFSNPVLCNYYLTYRCNAKCGFCDIWEKPSPYADAATVEANLREMAALGVKVVDFTGGEPLLHRDLPEFLRIAKSLRLITTVTTNTLLYPKYAEQIAGLVDMLHFSLDSPDRDAHNKSRGVECFDHLLESIRIAKELGEKPDILFTVTDENVEEISRVVEEISKPNDLFLILNPMFSYAGVGDEIGKSTMQELRRWSRKSDVYINTAFLDIREAGGNRIADPVCTAGSSTIVIGPDNSLIAPCYHLGVEHLSLDNGIAEAMASAEYRAAAAKAGRMPECEGCTINCYLEPSFATEINRYFFRSLPSTVKYALEKWVY